MGFRILTVALKTLNKWFSVSILVCSSLERVKKHPITGQWEGFLTSRQLENTNVCGQHPNLHVTTGPSQGPDQLDCPGWSQKDTWSIPVSEAGLTALTT